MGHKEEKAELLEGLTDARKIFVYGSMETIRKVMDSSEYDEEGVSLALLATIMGTLPVPEVYFALTAAMMLIAKSNVQVSNA